MTTLSFLENNYYKACELKNEEYEVKSRKLSELCNDMKLQSQSAVKSKVLSKLINEIFKIRTIISDIKWSKKTKQEKEDILEHCRLMIEVYLGKALVLELETK